MSNLLVYKDTGELLFDTNLISYGLVKSGYMVYLQSWTRKFLKSAQLDPNQGDNWTLTTATSDQGAGDQIYGFTVYNAISPIVFITGSGCLVGSSVSGSSITFYYTNASTSTRFYCFDLMADTLAGSTFLKTWDTTGRITFNSLQPPLNVIAAIQAPGPGGTDAQGRYLTCYAGGYNVQREAQAGSQYACKLDSRVDIAIGGDEYAAYLPWSRSVAINDLWGNNAFPYVAYSGSEGVYGYAGGITFMFGATGGTTQSYPSVSGQTVPASFQNLPTDRYPVALVISTAGLIFPYN
jgi:hypothetical protein